MRYSKFIIVTALILASATINAQSIGHTYNALINKAELNITDGRYDQALQNYEAAFADTKIEFTTDLYNASVCAVKLKNTQKVFAFAERLAAKGVGEKFFTRNIFRQYAADAGFNKITLKAEQVKIEKALANKKYTDKLSEFLNLDIQYNGLRRSNYHNQPKLPDTLQVLFTQNTRKLVDLIKSEGYYTEEKLGANISADTIIGSLVKPDIVVLHYLEMGNDLGLIQALKNILTTNLNAGTIRHYQASPMIAMTPGIFDDIGLWAFKRYECKIYRKTDIQNLSEIIQSRELYCMCSLEDFEKIITYKYTVNSDFDLKYSVLLNEHIGDMEFFFSAFSVITKIKNCES